MYKNKSTKNSKQENAQFGAKNPKTFGRQCPKRANVFSGKRFCRFSGVQQNNFHEICMQQCPKWANVFSGKRFCCFWGGSQNT